MLRLTRQKGQGIYVNGEATITVQEIKGQSVGIGIDAPASTNVRRCELGDKYEHIPPVNEELVNALACLRNAVLTLQNEYLVSGHLTEMSLKMARSADDFAKVVIQKATVGR